MKTPEFHLVREYPDGPGVSTEIFKFTPLSRPGKKTVQIFIKIKAAEMTKPTGWILLTKEFYKEFVDKHSLDLGPGYTEGHINGIFPIEEARVLWNKLQV